MKSVSRRWKLIELSFILVAKKAKGLIYFSIYLYNTQQKLFIKRTEMFIRILNG